ncbi:hypothetical protein CSB07_00820 [Candidatus Gracilibacteria bacterium]|nr:MAG: hypothetical protein CSB07_00820 [Candidatus Gracilibacteria bacterium]PIE85008.1 MAG: hypothetical protein CSA08_04150 [Candidatus Gracilibacteria bacterium]
MSSKKKFFALKSLSNILLCANIIKERKMNTLLEQLFDKYKISEKDKYEIRQIFNILPDEKKTNLISNFSVLVSKIEKINKDIEIEKEILIGKAVLDIHSVIEKSKRKNLLKDINKNKI